MNTLSNIERLSWKKVLLIKKNVYLFVINSFIERLVIKRKLFSLIIFLIWIVCKRNYSMTVFPIEIDSAQVCLIGSMSPLRHTKGRHLPPPSPSILHPPCSLSLCCGKPHCGRMSPLRKILSLVWFDAC